MTEPALALDTPMRALVIGEIAESNVPAFEAGEFLYGWFGWQTYCVTTADTVQRRVDPSTLPLTANLSLLGINGLTAYLALRGPGDPEHDEHVLVSTAAAIREACPEGNDISFDHTGGPSGKC